MAQTAINSNLASNKPLMNMIGAGNIDSTEGSNINLGNVQLQNGINAVYATGPALDTVKIITGSTVPLATGFIQSLVNINPANYINNKTHYFSQTFTSPSAGGNDTTGGESAIAGTLTYGIGLTKDVEDVTVHMGNNGLFYYQTSLDPSVASTGLTNQTFYINTTTLSADKTANDGWSDAGQIVMADNGRLPTETNY